MAEKARGNKFGHGVNKVQGHQVIRNAMVPRGLLRGGSGFDGTEVAGCMRGDLLIADGRVRGMQPSAPTQTPRMVIPWLVEVHCHLDKCHTAPRMAAAGGDLAQAIAAQMADKRHWNAADLRARMGRGLDEAHGAGVRLLRSHIDWGDRAEPPLAWQVLPEIDSPVRAQMSALVSAPQMADAEIGPAIARHVARAGGALGLFVLRQPQRREAVRAAFALAERFAVPLDFHVDESLDPSCDGLALIAQTAREMRFEGPILCGHACALMTREGDDAARLMETLAQAGITVAALPWTNLWLQGRVVGTPDRRGLTRLRELRAAGVRVAVGSDNVADAFCPTGKHDPMAALGLAVLAAHLDPPLADWLSAITTDAARGIGAPAIHVDGAEIADLCVFEGDVEAALAGRAGLVQPLAEVLERVEA